MMREILSADTPRVSVLMTIYNAAPFLREAISDPWRGNKRSDRCGEVLSHIPSIMLPQTSISENGLPLTYRIDKFLSTDFSQRDNSDEKIDATLQFCHNAYGNSL